ncbi:MAG: HlyD family efflux transporter periplasmic adaptor subunit [Oleiphilaceae bacterium]|nr:HlyD family efflux transporter periplasmic adaptor subunit [Oleiphilaceae bacterium]
MPKSFLGKWTRPVLILLVAVVVIALLLATKPEAPTRPSLEKVWQVSVASVEKMTAQPEFELYARSESPHHANLSTTLSSDVIALPALIGEKVKQGDVIVQLDDTDARIASTQALADVQELKARIKSEHNRHKADQRALQSEQRMYEIAKDALVRQQKLNASQLVAIERKQLAESNVAQSELAVTNREQSIKDHEPRLAQLQAQLKRAEARLELAQRDLGKTKITAPFDGSITSVNVSPGERVQAGATIATIFDTAKVEYKAQIPNSVLASVSTAIASGEKVHAVVKDKNFVLDRLSDSANLSHGGHDAWFLAEDSSQIPLNQSVKLVMKLPEQQDVIALPISSIYGTNLVFKVVDDRLESLNVDIIGNLYSDTQRDRILVRSNQLEDGDRIITTQLPKAINGLKVSIQGAEVVK